MTKDCNNATRKQYVGVVAEFDAEGGIWPQAILWEDGRRFPISKIVQVSRRASLRAGGAGLRFICMIGRKRVPLYYENPMWFIERGQ